MATIDDIKTNISRILPRLNVSASSIWLRICEVFAYFIDIIKLEILRSEQAIAQRTRATRITTREFYIEKAQYYQEGDNLTVIDNVTQEIGYAVIDESKRIIKQAAISLIEMGSFALNVATANADRNIVPLTQAQLNAFRTYYENFVGFGAQISIASNTPAIWNATHLYIRYDKTYSLDYIKQSVLTGLHDIQLISRPNSVVYVNEVEAYLTSLEGVRDAYFDEIAVTYDGDTIYPTDGSIALEPGYFNFNPDFYDWTKTLTIFEGI